MWTISLHQVCINAPIGLYPEEAILANDFEVDVDVRIAEDLSKRFVDYTILQSIVHQAFAGSEKTLEGLVLQIHQEVFRQFPFATSARIAIRKLHPPIPAVVGYAQVVLDKPFS